MKENELNRSLEANILSARIGAQIRALLAKLPPRSIEANRLVRLNWRVEATVKAILTQGESLTGEVGRLQSAFILRTDDPTLPIIGLPEELSADLASLRHLVEQTLPNIDEAS